MTGMYAIKIDVILLTQNDKGEQVEVKRPMEALQKAGLEGFITNFSLIAFECTNIEYNGLGRISKIEVKQLEL